MSLPPLWGKARMGGRGTVVSPPPAPSPLTGEGRCRMTDVTQYLSLSALAHGERENSVEETRFAVSTDDHGYAWDGGNRALSVGLDRGRDPEAWGECDRCRGRSHL